jgi:hypothetical protein
LTERRADIARAALQAERLQRPPQRVDCGLIDRQRLVGGGTCLREHHLAPQTVIVSYVPGDKSELKSGAKIFVAGAAKKEDGTLEAASISVGRDGLTPPM